ncbi:MAG: copper chaperone PCu(A)C [Propionibacterium sp.]|nr:copper chaperone PCu(A)C [Propionibacterium sp.]
MQFVSTDPHRDTDAQIHAWLDDFDPSFHGVRAAIDKVIAAVSSSATPGMAAAPSMATSAAYAAIRNAGDADDMLVSVSTPAAGEAQLHTTVGNPSGGGTMKRVTSIPVPAHGSRTLQMGGYHVMLLNLPEPLDEGDTVTMTWTFQSGTSITTAFPVISRVHRPGA